MNTTDAVSDSISDAEREAVLQALLVDAATYAENEPPPHDAIVRDLFDKADKVSLIASAKKRKSQLAMELALHIAAGRSLFLHLEIPRRRRVLIIQYEIKPDHFHRRLHRAARAHGIDADELRGWLTIVNARGLRPVPDFARLAALAKAELVILDPLYKLVDGDENKSEEMKPILARFDQLSREQGAAVMYLHHDKKGNTGDRDDRDRGAGSGVLARDFDAAIYLGDHAKDPSLIVVSTLARNYPPTPDKSVVWTEGRFILSDAEPVKRTSFTDRQKARTGARPSCPDSEKIMDAIAAQPHALTTGKADALIRSLGATKADAAEARKELLTEGRLAAWQPRLKNSPTYIGTDEQIARKRAEIESTLQKELPTA